MVRTKAHTLRDGMAAALARDFESAYPLLQQATTESPGDMRGWLWRAVASPSPADAIFCLRRVLLFEPADVQAQHALGRLLVTQASAIAASGQPAQARSLAREAADLAPECDAVWVGLALVSEGPEERLQALRRAGELNREAPRTRMLLRDAPAARRDHRRRERPESGPPAVPRGGRRRSYRRPCLAGAGARGNPRQRCAGSAAGARAHRPRSSRLANGTEACARGGRRVACRVRIGGRRHGALARGRNGGRARRGDVAGSCGRHDRKRRGAARARSGTPHRQHRPADQRALDAMAAGTRAPSGHATSSRRAGAGRR